MKSKILFTLVVTLFSIIFFTSASTKVEAAGCTWVGGSGSNWGTAANWGAGCSGVGGIPGNTDDLNIPNNTSTNNNISSLTLNSITFTGSPGGTLSGNAFTLNSSISSGFPHVINPAITLGNNVTLTTNGYNGGVNLNGHNITATPTVIPWGISGTLSGSGSINLTNSGIVYMGGASGAGTKVFNATGSSTQLYLDGSGWGTNTLVHLTNGAQFVGPGGGVTAITTDGTAKIAPSREGVITPVTMALGTNGLSLTPGDNVELSINGTNQGTDYDFIDSVGDIDLNGSTLTLFIGYTPGGGDTYNVIHTSGTLTGIFDGLPDGSVVHATSQDFIIHYTSTGVTLSAVGGQLDIYESLFYATPTTPYAGQAVTITVVWGTNFQMPTGTAELFDGSTSLGTVSLSGGNSVFHVSGFTAGSHTLTAHYSGNLIYPGLTSNPLVLGVTTALADTGIHLPVGIVISGLFLSLVGVVLFRRKHSK